jgi:hypothetical protein
MEELLMSEWVLTYLNKEFTIFESENGHDDPYLFKIFPYRGKQSLSEKLLERDWGQVCEYLFKNRRECSGITFYYDEQTQVIEQMAGDLAAKYRVTPSRYDVSQLKLHLEGIEPIGDLLMDQKRQLQLEQSVSELKDEKQELLKSLQHLEETQKSCAVRNMQLDLQIIAYQKELECVRSMSPGSFLFWKRYEIRGESNEIIYDRVTGLEWLRYCVGQKWDAKQQKPVGEAEEFVWEDACKQTAPGGFRLPTIDELRSLVYCSSGVDDKGNPTEFGMEQGRSCGGGYICPTIHPIAFPDAPDGRFWSSSPRYRTGSVSGHFPVSARHRGGFSVLADFAGSADRCGGAWSVGFANGNVDDVNKHYDGRARLVRVGQ